MDRIVIAEVGETKEGKRTLIKGDLSKCNICQINFTAKQPCVMCEMRINKEKELGRKMTQTEWDELFGWLR